ncbi:MAG: DUF2304 domain-containing protein [Comamonas sp.]
MASYQITTTILGIGFAAVILLLITRDHLNVRHGLFWFVIALVAIVLGAWPRVMDYLSDQVGVRYSPALLLVGAVIILFVKALHSDIVNTRIERQVRRLTQSLALLYLKEASDAVQPPQKSPSDNT